MRGTCYQQSLLGVGIQRLTRVLCLCVCLCGCGRGQYDR